MIPYLRHIYPYMSECGEKHYNYDIVMIEILAIYFQISLLIRKNKERRLKTLLDEGSVQPQIL